MPVSWPTMFATVVPTTSARSKSVITIARTLWNTCCLPKPSAVLTLPNALLNESDLIPYLLPLEAGSRKPSPLSLISRSTVVLIAECTGISLMPAAVLLSSILKLRTPSIFITDSLRS
ncbi:hypothetical protein D3C79_964600 [compost metagenome]